MYVMQKIAAPLIYIPNPKPNALVRVIGFSYAGGSASTYLAWQNSLDPHIELAVVQLPGRGARLAEQPYQTMSEIVTALFLAFEKLTYKPCIFYGHSMGARVAYELILMLQRFQCRLPVHFIASGSVAPCVKKTKGPTYHLPDDEFILKVRELNGSPSEVLANKELMELFLPALRADFKIIETYCNNIKHVTPIKISVLAGDEEEVAMADLEAWFELFETYSGIHWIKGDHFFVEKNRPEVLKTLHGLLAQYLM